MDGKDVADHAVEYGDSLGADYVEARYIRSKDDNYITRNGKFLGIQKKESRGIGIRVLVDGCMGFGSTNSVNRKAVEDTIDSVVGMAKLSRRDTPIRLSDEKTVRTKWSVPVKRPFADVPEDEKRNYIKELDKSIKRAGKRTIKNRILFMNMNTADKYTTTSHGSCVRANTSLISIMTVMNARYKDRKEQKMVTLGSSSGWEWLKEENIMSVLTGQGESLYKTVSYAKDHTFNRPMDVVVAGEVSGIMAHENVGHPSEGDRILGREAAQAGESFYSDILDEDPQIGNEEVTIIDDPTLKGSPGYYRYDEECVKARPRYLIKNGRLNELLLNRECAYRFDKKSNASARSTSYSREPIPRMSNTFFETGDHTKEELIEDVKNGILLNSFTEWNIDDRRFHSKYVGLEAYLIKNGEVTDTMVRRPVLELTTYGILRNVDAVSKEYESRMAPCGKSDPMQPIPVSVGGPHVRLRKVVVG